MEEIENPKQKLIENVNITNNVRNNSKSPTQIIEKSTEEKWCCCCIDYDLTISEYKIFSELKKRVIPPYDEKNPSHEYNLDQLLKKAKNILSKDKDKDDVSNKSTTNTNTTNDEDSSIWRKLGFQTGNPRTDFRAGGLFSLEFMNYFATYHKLELKNILKEKYFNFVLVSINLSFQIRLVLNLTNIINIEASLNAYNLESYSRKQIKHFSEQLEKEQQTEKDFLFSLMSQCLIFVFKKYQNEFELDKKELNFIKINSIIKSVIYYFGEVLNNIKKNENLEEKLTIRLAKELIGKSIRKKFD